VASGFLAGTRGRLVSRAEVDDVVEVDVRAIAAGGAGVADLPDGRVVFVPRTAPGDRARVTIDKSRAAWAIASLDRVTRPAEERIRALCPLYDRCGGCQLQHLPYQVQRSWKRTFVVDALTRIAKLTDVPEPEVVASPRTTGYRTRITFTLRRLRGGRVVAGLHGLARPGHVIDVHGECVLPRERIVRCWSELRAAWGPGARRMPAAGRLRLTLRAVGGGCELIVEGGRTPWNPVGLLDDVPGLTAILHTPSDADVPVLVAGDTAPGRGDAFEQVNPEGAALLYAYVLEQADAQSGDGPHGGEGPHGRHPSDDRHEHGRDANDSRCEGEARGAAEVAPTRAGRAVEAYCGAGRMGRSLASRGWSTVGIEVNASAAAAARKDAPERFQVVEGRVEERLPEALPSELLVVNPPRSGLGGSIPESILARPPERIIYVSCDPATLARDIGRLGPVYALTDLRCFDLFPHTAHVETVATLDRKETRP